MYGARSGDIQQHWLPSKRRKRRLALVPTAAAAALVLAACGSGDDNGTSSENGGGDEPYYADKTITILVPTDAGGSVDTVSRFLGEFLGKHLEGSPDIVIDNVTGGNQLVGANEYAQRRSHDGTQLFVNGNGTNLIQLFGHPQKEFDYSNYEPLLAFGLSGVVASSDESGIKEAADLLDPPRRPVYGGLSPSGTDLPVLLGFELLGIDYEPVLGYEASPAVALAFQQGEVDLTSYGVPEFLRDMGAATEAGDVHPLYLYGNLDESGGFVGDPLLPDLPHVIELYEQIHGSPVDESSDAYLAYKTIIASRALSNVLWVFNDAPEEAREALHEAVDRMVEDPDFKAGLEATTGGVEPTLGADIKAPIEAVTNPEPRVVDWVKQFLLENFDVQL